MICKVSDRLTWFVTDNLILLAVMHGAGIRFCCAHISRLSNDIRDGGTVLFWAFQKQKSYAVSAGVNALRMIASMVSICGCG
jgi:hypothetical protein